jgi:hypothetical protein
VRLQDGEHQQGFHPLTGAQFHEEGDDMNQGMTQNNWIIILICGCAMLPRMIWSVNELIKQAREKKARRNSPS